jgi:TolB-like protein
MQVESRRLAAIVVADVVGYSGMMERDEADTLARVLALRTQLFEPAAASRGGRIVKTTGDGLLLEFPSVVHAVDAAIFVQEQLVAWPHAGEPLMLRIGIHLGDVMVRDDDVFGTGVNLAARLEQAAEPGGVLISNTVFEQLAGTGGEEFVDGGVRHLKNISRPMQTWAWRRSGPQTSPRAPSPGRKPSIAVLPFENLSGDPGQDFLADGMVEDLTTKLSRFHWFHVIARASSYAVAEQTGDLLELGRRLDVRYALKGTIRLSRDRVRVSTQLVDAGDGRLVCADRFDGILDDIFDLQDEIVRSIIGEVVPQFIAIYRTTADAPQRSTSFASWESAMRGWNVLWRLQGPEDVLEARALFEDALEKDAMNTLAHCGMSVSFSNPYYHAQLVRDVERAEESARAALAIDDGDAFAWCALGIAELYGNHHDSAEHHLKRAVSLNPSLALAHTYLAALYCFRPDSRGTDKWAESARLLSPADPHMPTLNVSRAMARFGEGDYAGALAVADEAILDAPKLQSAWRVKSASLEILGHSDEATQAMNHALSLGPLTMTWMRTEGTPFADPEAWATYLGALERAGAPD